MTKDVLIATVDFLRTNGKDEFADAVQSVIDAKAKRADSAAKARAKKKAEENAPIIEELMKRLTTEGQQVSSLVWQGVSTQKLVSVLGDLVDDGVVERIEGKVILWKKKEA